jgi:hypothetical protein
VGVAWDIFLQEKLAADGTLVVDKQTCVKIAEGFKAAIAAAPPPTAP